MMEKGPPLSKKENPFLFFSPARGGAPFFFPLFFCPFRCSRIFHCLGAFPRFESPPPSVPFGQRPFFFWGTVLFFASRIRTVLFLGTSAQDLFWVSEKPDFSCGILFLFFLSLPLRKIENKPLFSLIWSSSYLPAPRRADVVLPFFVFQTLRFFVPRHGFFQAAAGALFFKRFCRTLSFGGRRPFPKTRTPFSGQMIENLFSLFSF